MRDEELERLRRSADPGSESEAQLIAATLRQGLYAPQQLDRAAYLGNELALQVLGETGRSPRALSDFLWGVVGWGAEHSIRAGLALCESIFPQAKQELSNEPERVEDLEREFADTHALLGTPGATAAIDARCAREKADTTAEGKAREFNRSYFVSSRLPQGQSRKHASDACSELPRLREHPDRLVVIALIVAELHYKAQPERGMEAAGREVRHQVRSALLSFVLIGPGAEK